MRKLILLSLIALTVTACDGPNDIAAASIGQYVHTGIIIKDIGTGKCIAIESGENVAFIVVACPSGEVIR